MYKRKHGSEKKTPKKKNELKRNKFIEKADERKMKGEREREREREKKERRERGRGKRRRQVRRTGIAGDSPRGSRTYWKEKEPEARYQQGERREPDTT